MVLLEAIFSHKRHRKRVFSKSLEKHSENEDAEVPSNTRGTRYNLRPNPNPNFSD